MTTQTGISLGALARKAALLAAPLAAIAQPALIQPALAGTLVMGSYPDKLLLVDDESGKVTTRIPLATGLPTSLRMTNDKTKIFVTTITTSGIEVLDAKTKKVLTQFSLNTPTVKYRFNGGVPDPSGKFYYTTAQKFDKLVDRYVVGKMQYVVIDIAQKKVVKAVDVPEEDNTMALGRSWMQISDDGKFLYMFRDKVVILDTATLKAVDHVDLAKPEGTGFEGNTFNGGVETLRNTSEYVSLFVASDPYIHNKQFGLGRFKLASKTFEFAPIGPAPAQIAGLQVTPDMKEGYTAVTQGITGNKRCEFWRFDLTDNKVLDKAEFPCRSRFQFGMSNDGKKLYIYGASYDIEVYDAKTLKWEKTWDLAADATMAGMLYTP